MSSVALESQRNREAGLIYPTAQTLEAHQVGLVAYAIRCRVFAATTV